MQLIHRIHPGNWRWRDHLIFDRSSEVGSGRKTSLCLTRQADNTLALSGTLVKTIPRLSQSIGQPIWCIRQSVWRMVLVVKGGHISTERWCSWMWQLVRVKSVWWLLYVLYAVWSESDGHAEDTDTSRPTAYTKAWKFENVMRKRAPLSIFDRESLPARSRFLKPQAYSV